MEKTSFGALLSRGYAGFKNNLTFYVALVLAITVLGYITDPQLAGSMATILSLLVFVLAVFVAPGIVKANYLSAIGEKVSFNVLFSQKNMILGFIILNVLTVLIVGLGVLLLIIPGLYFLGRYALVNYAYVVGAKGVMGSLKDSAQLTRGSVFTLLALQLLPVVLMFALGVPMVLLTLGTAAVDHIIPSIGAGIGSILLVLFITAASFIVQIALAYFYSETVKNSSGGVNAVVAEVAPEAASNAS